MDNRRINKIARLIQKALSSHFQRATQSIPGTLITVTRVTPSPDLSTCKVYLSIFPSERAQELIEATQKNSAQVRYVLGQELGSQLRVIPSLIFILDDTLDYLENIDRLLAQ